MIAAIKRADRHRLWSAAAVGAVHMFVAYIVISGLGVDGRHRTAGPLAVLELMSIVPAAQEISPPMELANASEPEGEAAAENLEADPRPVVAPPPEIRVETPPIAAAPAAGESTSTLAGASDTPDTGTGAGGDGRGLGSGLAGEGRGGGVRARKIGGQILDEDYPSTARRARRGGTVVAHFDIRPDGRVRNCRIVSSSGHAELDATTCRLIEARFRYRPARNARGEPVADVAGWQQTWWLERG